MQHITVAQLRELRSLTNAGMMDCRAALEATGGHLAQAAELLRQKAATEAARRANRDTGEGLVGAYVHHNSRLAAMVELRCETDFVARTDVFRTLLNQLAEQVAAAAPLAVSAGDLPAEALEARRRECIERAQADGIADEQIESHVDRQLAAFQREAILLSQPWIRDPSRTIQDLIDEASTKLGEKLRVHRIARLNVERA